MIVRNLSLLFVFMILLGCNQSDTNTESSPDEQAATDTQTSSTNDTKSDKQEETAGVVVARVNGSPIYEEDLRGRNVEFLVTEEVIYQIGLKQGVDKDYEEQVRKYQKGLIIKGTKAKILENADPAKKISDEEIQEYYDRNKDKYSYLRIHEISFPDPKMGEEIKAKAEKGEDLQEIANGYPDKPVTVSDRGFDRTMVENFSDNREVGAISEVVQKPNGTFAVLKIVEVREVPMKVSKKSIRHILEAGRTAQLYENYAREAAKENNIEIEIIE